MVNLQNTILMFLYAYIYVKWCLHTSTPHTGSHVGVRSSYVLGKCRINIADRCRLVSEGGTTEGLFVDVCFP